MIDRNKVLVLKAGGFTHQKIADAIGVSRSRIGQILMEPKLVTKTCERCGVEFQCKVHLASKQKFCGSKSGKYGCSRATALERLRLANKTPERKRQQRDLGKAWRKKQRDINGQDAIRQRAICRAYNAKHKDRIKILNKTWRSKNLETILHNNKQRMLLKRALGKVTFSEWMDIKKRFKFRCAACGISEQEIGVKWSGTHFTKLTMDHIVPIAQCGFNVASNIQPLCISCNSRKRDRSDNCSGTVLESFQELAEWRQKQFGTVVLTNGCFDLLHVGHVTYLQHSKLLGSSLVVGVNSNAAVSELKGEGRPINDIADRMKVLASMISVDAVIEIKGTNMRDFILNTVPDVWTKGGDYSSGTLNKAEVDAANSVGARIVIVPTVPGFFTTGILAKL